MSGTRLWSGSGKSADFPRIPRRELSVSGQPTKAATRLAQRAPLKKNAPNICRLPLLLAHPPFNTTRPADILPVRISAGLAAKRGGRQGRAFGLPIPGPAGSASGSARFPPGVGLCPRGVPSALPWRALSGRLPLQNMVLFQRFSGQLPPQSLFHGILASTSASPQKPVTPANTSPAPTKAVSQNMGCQK